MLSDVPASVTLLYNKPTTRIKPFPNHPAIPALFADFAAFCTFGRACIIDKNSFVITP
jgi:hypothetical protein